jgi:D-glycero-alpha-D-manno-heptose-7-phosphate kinase
MTVHLDRVSTQAVAPLRISVAGGGTDIVSYADPHGGVVVGFAIDVLVRARSRHALGQRRAPEPFERAVLAEAGAADRSIDYESVVPPGVGLGGSGAAAVAGLLALAPGRSYPAGELAERAAGVELRRLGRSVGRQDPYLAAFGGMRLMRFEKGRVAVEALPVGSRLRTYIRDEMLLFSTGVSRDASAVLARTWKSNSLEPLHAIKALTGPAVRAVENDSPEQLAAVIMRHWQLKREAEGSSRVHAVCSAALETGCAAVKSMGAGGGGYVLVCCTGNSARVRERMSALRCTELPFDLRAGGAEITV